MKKLLLLAAIVLLSCTAAAAQNTSVTGNVTGPNGFAWANGTGHASLVCPGNAQAYIGTSPIPRDYPSIGLDSNGNFTQGLYDTSVMVDVQGSPISCNYVYSFTEQCGISSFKSNPLTGVTGIGPVNLTAQINATVVNMSPQCTPNATGFLEQTVPTGAAPIFNSAGDTLFNYTLTQNVVSSTFVTSVPIGHGRVFQVHICQDGTGHWTMTWPLNVSLPAGYTLSAAPGSCSPVAFRTIDNGLTWQGWQIVGGGSSGGGGPLLQVNGTNNALQTTLNLLNGSNVTITADGAGGVTINSTGGSTAGTPLQKGDGFGAHVNTNLLETGTTLLNGDSTYYTGPNPEVDVNQYGARPIADNAAPAVPGLLITCVATNPVAALSGAGIASLQNGDGIVGIGCGNAHSMSTPSAPTVTAAIAVANTGTGYVATNTSAVTPVNRCYRIIAFDLLMGYTAPSLEACVNNGAATIGPSAPVNITSICRSAAANCAGGPGNTETYTTAAHILPVGCSLGNCGAVYVHGTSDEPNFGGWFPVASVPNNTSFTTVDGRSSVNGSSTSATGGSFIYYNSDHLKFPAFGAGMWQYAIYEGATGAETLVDVSLPNVTLINDGSNLSWDYYGTPYSANSSLPYFLPNTPPPSAIADALITTVASGGGGSPVTLTVAPSTTPASGTTSALFDDCPGIKAAASFANNFSGGGGMIAFPPYNGVNNGHFSYVINSYCSFSGSVSQSMPITLNNTLQFSGKWYGDLLNPNSLYNADPQFAIVGHVPINDVRAKPGIYLTAGYMGGFQLQPTGNNYIGLFHAAESTYQLEAINFANSNAANDYNGIMWYDWVPDATSFGFTARNISITTGPTPVGGASFTPAVLFKSNGEMNIDNVQMCCRGFLIAADGTSFDFKMRQEIQSLSEPLISIYSSESGSPSADIILEDIVEDTGAQPIISNFFNKNFYGGLVDMRNVNPPGSGVSAVSGAPFASVHLSTSPMSKAQVGQNINFSMTGQNGQTYLSDTIISPLNSVYVADAPGAAPTCSTVAGAPIGQLLNPATFFYQAVYPGGGQGMPSANSSAACGSDGSTNHVQVVIPASIPGAIAYNIFSNTPVVSQYGVASPGAGCASPSTAALTNNLSIYCGGGTTIYTTGGPSGLSKTKGWAPLFQMVERPTPPNPDAGTQYWYGNIATHKLACITSSGADCSPSPSSSVSSITGDGALITNSGSTGPVTLTLGTAVGYGVWGNPTASTAAPNYTALTAWPTAAFPTLNQNTTGTAGGLTGCIAATAGDVCVWDGAAWVVFTGNSTGTQVFQENNVGVPSWGSGASTTFEANGTPLSSASTVNFINSAATDGITLTFSNPGGAGNVQLGFTGTLTNAGLANSSVTFNGTTVALGASGNIPIQTNTVNNTSLAGLNMLTSTANVAGLTVTPVNSATNAEKFEVSGVVNASHGGTGQDLSAGTGVVQDNSGTISVSTGLANGTTATTQATGPCNSSTLVATTAFVAACGAGLSNPMTTIGDMIAGGASGTPQRLVGGKTGQSVVFTNGAAAAAASASVLDSTTVTSTPYLIACDTSTAVVDRGHTVPFDTGASVVTVPDSTASGCAGMILTVEDLNPSLTVNRSGSDTFTVLDGSATPLTGQTSFTLTKGQFATLKQGSSLLWRVEKKTSAGVGTIVANSPLSGSGSTTVTLSCATCVTSAASLTSTAIMTGGGGQASQTPNGSATLDSSGNMLLPGTLGVTGVTTLTQLNKVVFAGQQAGSDGAAKINTALGLSVYANGGYLNATDLSATAAFGSNMFAGIAANGYTIQFGGLQTATMTASQIIPPSTILQGVGRGGAAYGTYFKATTGFPSTTAMFVSGVTALDEGVWIRDMTLDCNNQTGCIGLQNQKTQENSGAERLTFKGFPNIGFDWETSNAQNAGPYRNFEFIPGSSAVTATLCFKIAGLVSMRGLYDVTCNMTGYTTQPTYGGTIDGQGVFEDSHFQGPINALGIGIGAAANGVIVKNMHCLTDTDCIKIPNTFTDQNYVLEDIQGSSITNLLEDVETGCTYTGTALGLYAVGANNGSGRYNRITGLNTVGCIMTLGWGLQLFEAVPTFNAASGYDILYVDPTTHNFCIYNSSGSPTCYSNAGGGTVTTTGSPSTGNLTKFTGSLSISNGDLSGDVTTSGTLATTIKTSVTLVTPIIGAATGTSLYATGIIDGKATMNVSTTTPCTLGTASANCSAVNSLGGYTVNEHATAATAIVYNLPTAAAGLQYCVSNGYNGSAANTGTLKIVPSATGQFIIDGSGVLTTNTTGYVISGGAARDSACVVGVDSTHWVLYTQAGSWVTH